ncbi:MAG: bifunctional adenosylcobinamide kinase/adenosylcobinamide-phosphate guanylyltransferase [Negativicutes bacterium]|nr:bifunctional adenosylcobinamide kinase/adenosylcobinamide-phosphate guanylyltransferase [Negativicutes bacterium]
MSGKIVLVTGGARSGKSRFAEDYVTALGVKVAYIATAQVLDGEMARRVTLHQSRRPVEWQTYEAPFGAAQILREAVSVAGAVLFDCLTVYTTNLMLSPEAPATPEGRCRFVQEQIAALLQSAKTQPSTVVFVTNEVGMGIVPDNALAREFRDLAGLVNQQVAAAADEVYLTISGLAVEIKKLAIVIDNAKS